jgi:hypothetical protein
MSNYNKLILAKKTLGSCYVYILWITIHYMATHLYTHLCTPLTFTGYFLSPFFVNAPHCQGLRWCIVHGAESINIFWLILGSWFTTKLVIKPMCNLGGLTQINNPGNN